MQQLVFLQRNWIVFKQHYMIFLMYSFVQPFLLLYGMVLAFQSQGAESANYLIPGFLVYTAVSSTFMGGAYSMYEHISTHRVYSWCSATITLPTVLFSVAIWQTIRVFLALLGILLVAIAFIENVEVHNLSLIIPILLFFSITSTFWGTTIATWATTISQIYFSDIVVYVAFILSGIFVPVSAFPDFVTYIAWCLPTWHAVEIIRPLFMDTPLPLEKAFLHTAVLLGQSLLAYSLSLKLLRKRVIT